MYIDLKSSQIASYKLMSGVNTMCELQMNSMDKYIHSSVHMQIDMQEAHKNTFHPFHKEYIDYIKQLDNKRFAYEMDT